MVIIPLKSYFLSLLLLSLFTYLIPSSAASLHTYTTLDLYDRVVLVRIQNHFGGPKSGFWNSSDPNCCVYCYDNNVPITCGEEGHVRRLYLTSRPNLSGTIPSAISDLPELYDLTITGTGFIGSMPAAFGKMNMLNYLVINNTRITGTIPRSLGRLNNLSVLQLSYNRFYGFIPDSLAHLTNVYQLDLSHNKLSGPVPDFLIKMTSLLQLDLGSNRLHGPIPEFLGQTGLKWIDLSSNKLFGTIPESLGNLTNLEQLILHSNKLYGQIPEFVSHMVFGGYISLHSNHLTGEIPEGSWTSLDQFSLYLNNNQLTGKVPLSLASAWFYDLDLSGNKLMDASHLFNRDTQGQWENLDLSNNLLKFDFSHASFPREQRVLNISHNMIHGFLPRQLAKIHQGSSLDVSYNELCGPIPRSSVLEQLNPTNFEHNKCLCGAPLPPCNYTLPPCSALSPSPT